MKTEIYTITILTFLSKTIYIIEIKGREELNDIRKIQRLKTWCQDVNNLQQNVKYIPIYIKQENWNKYREDIRKFADKYLRVFIYLVQVSKLGLKKSLQTCVIFVKLKPRGFFGSPSLENELVNL